MPSDVGEASNSTFKGFLASKLREATLDAAIDVNEKPFPLNPWPRRQQLQSLLESFLSLPFSFPPRSWKACIAGLLKGQGWLWAKFSLNEGILHQDLQLAQKRCQQPINGEYEFPMCWERHFSSLSRSCESVYMESHNIQALVEPLDTRLTQCRQLLIYSKLKLLGTTVATWI